MNKAKLIKPTSAEDAAINAGIGADPDTTELTDLQFAAAVVVKRGRGRPLGSVAGVTKQPVTLRLDPDVLQALKATGPGWQTRVNEILRVVFELQADGYQAMVQMAQDLREKTPEHSGDTVSARRS